MACTSLQEDSGEAPASATDVRIIYPEVANDEKAVDTMVHSKIMVVDDRLLRRSAPPISTMFDGRRHRMRIS